MNIFISCSTNVCNFVLNKVFFFICIFICTFILNLADLPGNWVRSASWSLNMCHAGKTLTCKSHKCCSCAKIRIWRFWLTTAYEDTVEDTSPAFCQKLCVSIHWTSTCTSRVPDISQENLTGIRTRQRIELFSNVPPRRSNECTRSQPRKKRRAQ